MNYDYLIVGAGSAGCVLAHRLSANPAQRVLLLEAGGSDTHLFVRMPAAIARLMGNPRFNWNYNTEAQTELDGRRLYWPRGRVVGGSSSINAMCYIRGQHQDYDEWHRAGATGWSWDDVLPAFRRSENFAAGPNRWHGGKGPLHVQSLRYTNPLTDVFLHATEQAGYASNADFNGATQEGCGQYHVTQRDGRRWSSASAFLRPAMRRSNLTIMRGAQALRVLFDGTRARGVEAQHQGKTVTLEAGHVILSGGSVNSPQLLMLSGIGPADHLRQFDIPVVADRPQVGANLQDHLDICTLYKCTQPITYDFGYAGELGAGLRYLLTGGGPGSSNVAEAGGFVRSALAQEGRPDVQLHFVPAQLDDHGRNRLDGHGFTLHACSLRPKSRGVLRLASADPLAHPAIDPRYLSDPHDLAVMIECVRISRQILSQPAFDPYRGACVFPAAESRNQDDIAAFIRRKAESIYHPIGTCRMGRDDDAVVTPELKVNGVQGLTVCDASVMPTLISGNTNATTMMIAERAANILQRNGQG